MQRRGGSSHTAGKVAKSAKKTKCVIPPSVPDSVMTRFTLGRNENEAKRIAGYVERECAKDNEAVTYLEEVKSETVYGTRHVCWNVRTDKSRFWVITNPTNLYSQELFPSLDYTLSFHVGLMARVHAQHKATNDSRVADRLAQAARRWEQAASVLDESQESEDVQAIGMRCRECLIVLARSVATAGMVPLGSEPPKAADFVGWSELIANAVTPGSHASEARGYLKSLARSTWQLVSWLTHCSNAVRYDGAMALSATQEVLNAFGVALVRQERKEVDRCPRCQSLRLTPVYSPMRENQEAPSQDDLTMSPGDPRVFKVDVAVRSAAHPVYAQFQFNHSLFKACRFILESRHNVRRFDYFKYY